MSPRLAVELPVDFDVEAGAFGDPDDRSDAANVISTRTYSVTGDSCDIGEEFEVDSAVSSWEWTSMAEVRVEQFEQCRRLGITSGLGTVGVAGVGRDAVCREDVRGEVINKPKRPCDQRAEDLFQGSGRSCFRRSKRGSMDGLIDVAQGIEW